MEHDHSMSLCDPRAKDLGRTAGQAALTPLLDTLFLLLFSVLAASDGAEARADVEEEVRLELPSVMDDGATESDSSPESSMVIAIEASGAVLLDGGALPADSPAAFSASLADVPLGTSFEIRAHADARHAVVMEVLHGLREQSFLDVSLVALKRSGETEPSGWGSAPR